MAASRQALSTIMSGENSTGLEHFVWDFNGTILDDLEITLDSINTVLRARKLPSITIRTHREGFRFPIQEYYRDLGFDLQAESFEEISREYHTLYMKRIHECGMYEGVEELIEYFRSLGVRQYILSALHEPLLHECVDMLGIGENFEAVYGLGDLLARSKTERGLALRDDFSVVPDRAALLGDTEHDMEVARALGVLPVAAGWGHQSSGMFNANGAIAAARPNAVIPTLREQAVLVA